MLFKVGQLIYYVSIGYRLRQGDVIVCDTPEPLTPADDDVEAKVEADFDHMVQYVGRVHMKLGDICEVEINTVWDPPWTSAKISSRGRKILESFGVAL